MEINGFLWEKYIFFLMINFIYYYHQFFITKFSDYTYLLTNKMWKVCKPDFVDRYVIMIIHLALLLLIRSNDLPESLT